MKTNKETSHLNREAYEAPVMETVEVMVELGFQMSGAMPSSSNDPLKEQIF